MIKYVANIMILLGMLGCNPTQHIVGNYYSDNKSIINRVLKINQDGSFNYYAQGDLIDASSFGTWKISYDKKLILNSDESLKTGVIDCVEEYSSPIELLSVKLIDEGGLPLGYAGVLLNEDGTNGFAVDENGYGSIKFNDLKILTISYLGNKYEYILSNPKNNKLTITIRLQSNESIFFNNEIWKVRKNKLINNNNLILRKN
ncbi:MAG: hypothetical protein JNN12_01330 [Bacteroidetes Order II. Incertae sedis bacterium]|nr:hypothetical protein [Bacteroidetes Order II. bacterium]